MRSTVSALALLLASCAAPAPPSEVAKVAAASEKASGNEKVRLEDPPAPENPFGAGSSERDSRPESPAAPPRAVPPVLTLPPLPEPEAENLPGAGRRIGRHRDLPDDWLPQRAWNEDGDGPVWRAAIRSPGAVALRLHFADLDLGEGVLAVREPDDQIERAERTLRGRGPAEDGEAWSDILEGDTAVVEYRPPAGASTPEQPPFRVDKISHMWRSPLEAF